MVAQITELIKQSQQNKITHVGSEAKVQHAGNSLLKTLIPKSLGVICKKPNVSHAFSAGTFDFRFFQL